MSILSIASQITGTHHLVLGLNPYFEEASGARGFCFWLVWGKQLGAKQVALFEDLERR